jgi:menaquinol-cytochrome c reductase iron-sulfur subunit
MCERAQSPPPTRRKALFALGGVLMTIGGGLAAIPVLGFVLAPLTRRYPNQWVGLGKVTDFPEGQTRLASYRNPRGAPWDGSTDRIPCWVRRIEGQRFQVFSIHCTHLGCPVKWFQESGLFMCPCHGGIYYEDGSRAAGPPPRGLYTYPHKVVDGRLEINAGRLPTLHETV